MKYASFKFWYSMLLAVTLTSVPVSGAEEPSPRQKALSDGKSNPFVGTWELIAGKYRMENTQFETSTSLKLTSLKIINATHFSFSSYSKGKFWASGTGTYDFTLENYTEAPILVSYPMEKGKRYEFTYQISGDLWTNRRVEKGQLMEEEVWRRVSAGVANRNP